MRVFKGEIQSSFFSQLHDIWAEIPRTLDFFPPLGHKMIGVPTTKPSIIQMVQGRGPSSLC